jgi:fucose 4-O-acetylase-like acetyltransferase
METQTKEINYGFALLRLLMCFEVVLCHYWGGDGPKYLKLFSILRNTAVPVFMFLSFYLTENTFLNYKKEKALKRIERLVIPQIGWAIIYWICLTIGQIKIQFGVKFTDLIWQIFSGHSPRLNPAMWFQIVLIVLSLIYIFLFKFLDIKKGIVIIFIMFFISIVMQYTGINFKLFDSMRYELKYPLGRFCEMIPYATLGFLCAYYRIFERLKEIRLISIIMFGLVSVFLLKYEIINSTSGFGYSDNNCILFCFFVVGFAYLMPFEYFSFSVRKILKVITKYTLGIYCMHNLVATFFKLFFSKIGINMNGFILCMITYFVGFLISYIMSKIPVKYIQQLFE